MALNYDKIRVLWIEDQPGIGEQSENLEEYSELFEIINYANTSAVGSIEKYEEFLFHHLTNVDASDTKQTSVFPVEIVSVDYDLSKNAPDSNTVGIKNWKHNTDIRSIRSSSQSESHQGKSSITDISLPREVNYDDYDGCIINMLYLSEFSAHPCGSVITTYQDPKGRHRCAKVFEKHLERRHQVDLTYSGVRTWESILNAGVKALRLRIEYLYKEGFIVISPSDLMALTEDPSHDVLTIQSPHSSRRLPVQGLFIDINADNRGGTISKWSEDLLKSKVSRETYISALNSADVIWDTYNNDSLMEKHACFSELQGNGKTSSPQYKELDNIFKLIKTGKGSTNTTYKCTQYTVDIAHIKADDKVKRWAALFLIRKLIKRFLLFIDALAIEGRMRNGEARKEIFAPSIEEDDIFLLLYPIPESPFPLPWHISDSKNSKTNYWRKYMKNDLSITFEDIKNGTGLTVAERQILQGIVMDEDVEFGHDPEMRLERWKSYEPARLFLFGTDKNSGSIKDE